MLELQTPLELVIWLTIPPLSLLLTIVFWVELEVVLLDPLDNITTLLPELMTVPLLLPPLLILIEFIAAERSCVKSFIISFIEFDSVVQTFLIDDIVSNGNTANNDITTIPIIVSIEGLFSIR
jgi:ABC-type glucose/galactose transport system permease subunit